MRQKFIPLLLAFALLLGLAGCNTETGQGALSSGNPADSVSSAADLQQAAEENSSTAAGDADTTVTSPAAGSSSKVSESTTLPKSSSAVSRADTGSAAQEPPASIQVPSTLPTAHQPVNSSDYYGYQQLSSSQKKIYEQIDAAVYSLQNDLPVFGTWESIQTVFGYYLADHPQCFWLGRVLYYSYGGAKQTLHLVYSDGDKTDTYDNTAGKWTSFSDHKKIQSQIAAYQKQIAAVVNEISPSLTVLEKEKKIHDYILRQVTYPDPIPEEDHLYTSYGALINGEAVCEGYAKLFQHLCYEVGINCLQVTGTGITSSGTEPHMWNLVRLDEEWYQVDVTWDDAYNDDKVLSYRYFNLTDQQMNADHKIGTEDNGLPTYPAPACTATKYHYYTNFCINVTRDGQLSTDAVERIKQSLKLGDRVLYILFPDGIPGRQSISQILFGGRSSVKAALKEADPSRSLETTYLELDDTCVMIKLK